MSPEEQAELINAVSELLFHFEDEEREHGFPLNFHLRAAHRKLKAVNDLIVKE